jgi:hypothetical protein
MAVPNWVTDALKTINGNRGLFMLGAAKHGVTYDEETYTVTLRLGRNSSGGNVLKIILDRGKDLYNLEIRSIRKASIKSLLAGKPPFTDKVKHRIEGIYFDQVWGWVEEKTGMYLSLGTLGR